MSSLCFFYVLVMPSKYTCIRTRKSHSFNAVNLQSVIDVYATAKFATHSSCHRNIYNHFHEVPIEMNIHAPTHAQAICVLAICLNVSFSSACVSHGRVQI